MSGRGKLRQAWDIFMLIPSCVIIGSFGLEHYRASVVPEGSMAFSPKYPARGMLDEGLHFRMPFVEDFVIVKKKNVLPPSGTMLKDKVTGDMVMVTSDQIEITLDDLAKYHEATKTIKDGKYDLNIDVRKELTDEEVHAICTSPNRDALEAVVNEALNRAVSARGFRAKATGLAVWKATQL